MPSVHGVRVSRGPLVERISGVQSEAGTHLNRIPLLLRLLLFDAL